MLKKQGSREGDSDRINKWAMVGTVIIALMILAAAFWAGMS